MRVALLFLVINVSVFGQYQVNSVHSWFTVNNTEGTSSVLALAALAGGNIPSIYLRGSTSTPRDMSVYFGGTTARTPSTGGVALPDGQIINLEPSTVSPTPLIIVGVSSTPTVFMGTSIPHVLRARMAFQAVTENPASAIGVTFSAPAEVHICGDSPTGLSAIAGQNSVRLDWVNQDPAQTGARVSKLDPGEDENIYAHWDNVGGDLPQGTTSYVVTGLTPGATYKFRVRSIVPCGYTSFSNVVTVPVVCSLPPAPINLSVSPTSPSSVFVSWQDLAFDEFVYRISRLDPGEDPNNPAHWDQVGGQQGLAPNTQNFSDSGLTPNGFYMYRVRCESFCGLSGFSNYGGVVMPCPYPTPPINFGPISVGIDSLILGWTNLAGDATEIRVSRLDPGEDPNNPAHWDSVGLPLAPTTTSLFVGGLAGGQTYQFRVRATGVFNAFCQAPYVGPISVQMQSCPGPPPAPFNCLATRQGNTPGVDPILVTWSYSGPGISGFRVSRLPPGGDPNNPNAWGNVGGDLGPNTFSFTDTASTGLTLGGTWNYRVRAFLDGPCGRVYSDYSNSDPANP